MSWKDTKNIGDIIDHTDWNEQAQTIIQTSGAFWAHSSNSLNPHNVTLEQARSENNALNGTIDMGGFKILNLAEPSSLSDATSKEYVDRAITSLGAAYFTTDKTDPDTGYKLCSLFPPSGAESYLEVANLTDNALIGSWISDIGESPSVLLKGISNWFLFLEKRTGTKTLRVYWKMFERSGTSETEIASSSVSNEITSKESQTVPLLLETDYIPWSSSRIVGKLYARVTGTGNAPTIRLYYQGNTASRWEIPANSEIFRYILVPYSGAKKDIYLGNYSLTASGLTANELTLDSYTINEISNDTNLTDNSQIAVPTEYAVKVYGDTNFYPSSQGKSLYTSYTNHSGQTNKHIDHSTVSINAGTGLSGGGDITQSRTLEVLFGKTDTTVASGSHIHDDRYYTESESDSKFYPSSIGAGLSGSYHSHKGNASAHHTRYSNKEAQDAVGNILDDGTQGEIVFTYDDSTPKIYATVQDSEIDHNQLLNTHNLTSDIDHGNIAGLSDDDHPQYYNQSRITRISSNAVSGQKAKTWLDASGSKYNTAYQHSQTTSGNPHNIGLTDIGESKGNLSASSPLSFTSTRQVLGGTTTISISQATSTTDGYLSSTDWNTFNGKQDGFSFGTLSNGIGIQSFSVGISGGNANIAVNFGNTDTTVASGSHTHDSRYYTKSQSDSHFYPSSLGHSHIADSSIHFTKSSIYLNDLSNISVPSPTSGNSLIWNGSSWVDKTIAGGESITWGTLNNGTGIQSFSAGISGNNATISVSFGKTNTTVASGSHLHDDRYYTESEADSNFFPSSTGHSHINNTSNPHNVTYSQIGAIQDTNDVIKDTHIDWGTGTNQVSLDDVPDGTTYAKLTATQKTDLTDSGDSTLHYHSSDRDLSNATGTLAHEMGGLEADVSSYNGLVKIAGGSTSYITDSSTNWNSAYSHKTTEDAINGLVKCDGAGGYSAVTDNSSNWNTAYTHSQMTTGNPHQISVDDLTDTSVSSPTSGNSLIWNGTSWIDKSVGGGSSYWSSRTGGIYYNGEVTIGPSDFDIGDYNLQVSGASFFSGETVFKGNTISGLSSPPYPSAAANKHYVDSLAYVSSLSDTTLNSLSSGQVLTYKNSSDKWVNTLPALTFSIANIKISAQQNINLARFTVPTGKSCYVWQASACGSGGSAISDLEIQILSGTTVIYGTTSCTVQQGYPLAKTNGNIEIRLAYSGGTASGYKYGTGFMNISII